ncbi:MAG TPA: hypothetical protein DEA63_01205 [Firmicutes bacterium]|nr:hypothetical protein [Bacillota bacterium]
MFFLLFSSGQEKGLPLAEGNRGVGLHFLQASFPCGQGLQRALTSIEELLAPWLRCGRRFLMFGFLP